MSLALRRSIIVSRKKEWTDNTLDNLSTQLLYSKEYLRENSRSSVKSRYTEILFPPSTRTSHLACRASGPRLRHETTTGRQAGRQASTTPFPLRSNFGQVREGRG
ncbi:hypothetical protein PUN28_017082 [Cardiocondyla obscurior]|uniref:Uncharacterized protein n=1 Tax=Cardiocondyla obscurior TaxID=286306 RepID=A0AAW2EK62_9HYME